MTAPSSPITHSPDSTLLSSKDASKRFGYSSDYITRLAREGKISGRRIGTQWFVEPISLEKFKQDAETQKKRQVEDLSIARKIERVKTEAVVEAERVGRLSSEALSRWRAGAQSLGAVVFGGVTAFVLVFSGGSPGAFLEGAGSGVQERAAHLRANVAQYADSIRAASAEWWRRERAAEPAPAASEGSVVGVFEDEAAARDMAESFSDPVEVIFDAGNPHAGVIKPMFTDTEGEYRFLLVPVTPARSPE